MKALYVVYGIWILYCLFWCQLVQISNGNPKNFKVLICFDFGKLGETGDTSKSAQILSIS